MLVAWVLLLRSTYLWPGASSGVNVALDQGVLGYQTNSKTIYTAFLWQDSRDFIGIAVILQWLRFIECVPPPFLGGVFPPPFFGVCVFGSRLTLFLALSTPRAVRHQKYSSLPFWNETMCLVFQPVAPSRPQKK